MDCIFLLQLSFPVTTNDIKNVQSLNAICVIRLLVSMTSIGVGEGTKGVATLYGSKSTSLAIKSYFNLFVKRLVGICYAFQILAEIYF